MDPNNPIHPNTNDPNMNPILNPNQSVNLPQSPYPLNANQIEDVAPPEMRMLTPQVTRRDPSLLTVATVSTAVAPSSPPIKLRPTLTPGPTQFPPPPVLTEPTEQKKPSCWSRFVKYLYNKEDKTFCGRTCMSWLLIIAYSIMYLIFLTTYFFVFLYGSLCIVKGGQDYENEVGLLQYSDNLHQVGLTATPTAENSFSLIWYRSGTPEDYDKYVNALDRFFLSRREKRQDVPDLGPCGRSPYGYGEAPCVIVRINKQISWAPRPLETGSDQAKKAPEEVQSWLKGGMKKYWLHCTGYHPYDKEHIGKIRYYPYPPGFESDVYPINENTISPLIAIQFHNFTMGLSLAIECKLWYSSGVSSLDFMIYVGPKSRYVNHFVY